MDSLTLRSERLVHLDLKGAPPRLSFLEKFFPFIKSIGATGILLEWEDTFPYTKDQIHIGGLSDSAQATGAPYSIEEAKQILEIASDCGLSVIPLVQTIGHMEFVLKHGEYRPLREVEAYPSSMCPSHSEALPLVRSMVKQILAMHSDAHYIHIGADEVWHLGLCGTCTKRSFSSKYGKAALYLDHVTEVAQFIKDNYPNVKVIIWDDMIRNVDVSVLKDYGIGSLVEPMVWHYNSSENFQLDSTIWEKYSNVFTNAWIASAFKGATTTCQILPVNKYHISNHEAWLSNLNLNAGKILNFRGIAFTGWSRYDHYANLCELLPCAIPSLCLCMKTWLCGRFSQELHESVGKLLGYADAPPSLDGLTRNIMALPELSFPGCQVLVGFEWFLNFRTRYRNVVDSDQIHTWFNQWQILNNYTNPMQIESLLPVLSQLLQELTSLENYLRSHLEQNFYPHTVEEMMGTLIAPMKQNLGQLKGDCETQLTTGCRVRGRKRLNM